jgi:hypothetical protein
MIDSRINSCSSPKIRLLPHYSPKKDITYGLFLPIR